MPLMKCDAEQLEQEIRKTISKIVVYRNAQITNKYESSSTDFINIHCGSGGTPHVPVDYSVGHMQEAINRLMVAILSIKKSAYS